MTSKDAILWLHAIINEPQLCGGNLEDNNNALNTIEKELEVLEILKDRLYFDYQFNVEDRVYHKIVMKFISFTDDDYEKVKEWLNNDNIRND